MTELPARSATAPGAGYWDESRRPLVSLVFIAPLLLVYEAGVLVLGPSMDRNGVDVWLRTLLEWVGLGHYFLLPVLTACVLLGWHHVTRQPWRVSRSTLGGMAVESVLLALCLRLLLLLQGAVMPVAVAPGSSPLASPPAMSVSATLGNLVMFLGAGIYEELLFRLILLSAVAWGLRRSGLSPRSSVVVAVVVTSLVFSAAHHVGPHGEWPIDAFRFSFRFVAGVFFSVLFVYRGFGIAAGAHAGYDILAVLVP